MKSKQKGGGRGRGRPKSAGEGPKRPPRPPKKVKNQSQKCAVTITIRDSYAFVLGEDKHQVRIPLYSSSTICSHTFNDFAKVFQYYRVIGAFVVTDALDHVDDVVVGIGTKDRKNVLRPGSVVGKTTKSIRKMRVKKPTLVEKETDWFNTNSEQSQCFLGVGVARDKLISINLEVTATVQFKGYRKHVARIVDPVSGSLVRVEPEPEIRKGDTG
jgi:hypothetical protein